MKLMVCLSFLILWLVLVLRSVGRRRVKVASLFCDFIHPSNFGLKGFTTFSYLFILLFLFIHLLIIGLQHFHDRFNPASDKLFIRTYL